MWPFTGKRIFGSRWWAIAFVIFVCWQVAMFAGRPGDAPLPLTMQDTQNLTDALNSI